MCHQMTLSVFYILLKFKIFLHKMFNMRAVLKSQKKTFYDCYSSRHTFLHNFHEVLIPLRVVAHHEAGHLESLATYTATARTSTFLCLFQFFSIVLNLISIKIKAQVGRTDLTFDGYKKFKFGEFFSFKLDFCLQIHHRPHLRRRRQAAAGEEAAGPGPRGCQTLRLVGTHSKLSLFFLIFQLIVINS